MDLAVRAGDISPLVFGAQAFAAQGWALSSFGQDARDGRVGLDGTDRRKTFVVNADIGNRTFLGVFRRQLQSLGWGFERRRLPVHSCEKRSFVL